MTSFSNFNAALSVYVLAQVMWVLVTLCLNTTFERMVVTLALAVPAASFVSQHFGTMWACALVAMLVIMQLLSAMLVRSSQYRQEEDYAEYSCDAPTRSTNVTQPRC